MWRDDQAPSGLSRVRAVAVLFGFVAASAALLWSSFVIIDLVSARSRQDSIVVGSKKFTESVLLAEIIAQLVERESELHVVRQSNLGGTEVCFQALRRGDVDLYVEYTGTGLTAILGEPPITDSARVLTRVREAFHKEHQLVWLDPLGFNNTYALAMTERQASALKIRSISDLRLHNNLRAGFATEFLARKDGYPGLKSIYGLDFKTAPKGMEAGLMYTAVQSSEVDVISAYATDARIDKMKLRLLSDDRHAFPPYQAAALVRAETLRRHPELQGILKQLSGKLDDAKMRRLNGAVDVERRPVADVAREFVETLPR